MSAARPARAFPLREAGAGAAAALALAALAFASGAYFPTAWGWGALGAFSLVAISVVAGAATRPSWAALASLGALTAFAAWTALGAVAWSDSSAQSLLESHRLLLFVGMLAALVLVVRRANASFVAGGVLVAVTAASGYGLASRVFPERLGVFEPTAGYRLSEPLGYWNGLGVFAAIGGLLALGFAARGASLLARALAAATLPVLLCTVYFTFSRGAWIAGAIGLLAAFAVDPRRLQLAVVALALAGPSAIAVLVSSRQDALTETTAPLAAATEEGHRLAVVILVLAAASAALAVLVALAERRVEPPRTVRLAFAALLAAVAVASLAAVFVRFGGPVTLTKKAYDAFTTTEVKPQVNLNERLFTFSGSYRAELWREAWDDYEANPLTGSGPGTYEEYWNRHRPIPHIVRDAHNLYLETLAETGPVGLALLLVAFGVPLAAAFVARRDPLVPAVVAGLVAYLLHSAVDWNWELSAVTVVALTLAAVLLAFADRRPYAPPLLPVATGATVAAALVLAALAFTGLVGASALAASEDALDKGRYGKAEDEAEKAASWWRWSPEPWERLGDAQAAQNRLGEARASYRKAISKDEGDWSLWYALSTVSTGAEADRAAAEARRLNPFYRRTLDEES